jgi:ribosomal protein S2
MRKRAHISQREAMRMKRELKTLRRFAEVVPQTYTGTRISAIPDVPATATAVATARKLGHFVVAWTDGHALILSALRIPQ